MRRAAVIVGLLVAAVAAALTGTDSSLSRAAMRTTTASTPSPWSLALARAGQVRARALVPGVEHAYEVSVVQSARPGSGNAFQISLTGTWAIAYAGTDARGLMFRAELRDAHPVVKHSNRELAMSAAAFNRTYYFTTTEQGQLVMLHLPADMDDLARGTLSTLASVAQLSLGTGSTWQAIESDTLGEYDVRYTEVARGLHRTRERYRRTSADSLLETSIVASGTDIELRADGWPAELRGNESTRVGTPELGVVGELRFSLRHAGIAHVDAGWPDGLEAVAVDEAAANSRIAEIEDRELADGVTFEDLLAELARTTDQHGRGYQFLRMAALFRLDPASIALAERAVAAGDPKASVIVGALGEAGTSEAQRALAGMLATPAGGDAQLNAAVALGLTRSPTESTFAALAAAARGDGELASTSLLALGNATQRIADEDPTQAARYVDDLLARFARASSDEERALVVLALGNTGDPRIVPALQQALASPNVQLRAAATEALRLVPGVDPLIAARLADVASPVREAAVFAAAQRDLSPLLAALASAARRDKDTDVRRAIVELAGARIGEHDGLRAIVTYAAAHDPDPELREVAQRFLTPA